MINSTSIQIIHQDCREYLKTRADNSIDSCVTDPPYNLGFMGKSWDKTGIANNIDLWREVVRVLKPGGYLLAFPGSRTYHRMASAIEDAGFDIRDQVMWIYGSGFPKSHNLKNDWDGWGSALKPAHEPICMARKPLEKGLSIAENVQKWETGAIWIDGCRVEIDEILSKGSNNHLNGVLNFGMKDNRNNPHENSVGRWPANIIHDGSDDVLSYFPDSKGQQGVAKSDNSFQNNKIYGALKHGTHYPAPRKEAEKSTARFFYCAKASKQERNKGLEDFEKKPGGMRSETSGQHITRRDGGDPDPVANIHPTVKPVALMQYLVRLITPPNGIVLDPFSGSGTTGIACKIEQKHYIGIEQEQEYVNISRARIDAWQPKDISTFIDTDYKIGSEKQLKIL